MTAYSPCKHGAMAHTCPLCLWNEIDRFRRRADFALILGMMFGQTSAAFTLSVKSGSWLYGGVSLFVMVVMACAYFGKIRGGWRKG